jgi:hypothetical protein
LTTGATARGRGLLRQGLGLAGEGEVEHLLGQDFADFQEEVFDVGEGSAPGRPLRAVKLIDEVFGDTFDVGPHLFRFRRTLLGSCHPWVLSELVSKRWIEFLSPSVKTLPAVCKPCRAP